MSDARPFGDDAWRLARPADSDAAGLSRALLALPGVTDVVVAERHLLVLGEAPLAAIESTLSACRGQVAAPPAREHVVPVIYDGEDLPGLGPDVAARHAAASYRVAMLGFLPGFAYLSGLPQDLVRPRRASPRPRVPAGALAIAGPYSGIYPLASPGGWNLIGRAPGFRAFDPVRGPTFALGDALRFEVARGEPPKPPPILTTPAPSGIVVLAGLALVQDGGRRGRLHLGLPPGGAMIPPLLAAANAAVGNPWPAPALELIGAARVAAHGHALHVSIDGEPAIALAAGDELVVPASSRRARYLAVAGGIDAPAALLCAGIGGPLAHRVAVGVGGAAAIEAGLAPAPLDDQPLRVRPGPDLDAFPPGAFAAFLAAQHRIGTHGNRSGVRLIASGEPPWRPLAAASGVSAPMRLGAVQITPSGEPIVLGSEHPVTGGYSVLAVVHIADIAKLFAKAPGDSVSLRA